MSEPALARRAGAARLQPLRRFLCAFLAVLALALFLRLPYWAALDRPKVMSVEAPGADLFQSPAVGAQRLYTLQENSKIYFFHEERTEGGEAWGHVAILYKPPQAILEERLDGWMPLQRPDGRPALKAETFVGQALGLRTFYKWSILSRLRPWMRDSKALRPLRALMPLRADKAFHVLTMFLVSVGVYCLAVLLLSLSPVKALLFSLLATNLLGLSNEIVDLFSGRGNFEKGDLAANALGSAGLLVPAGFWALLARAQASWCRKGRNRLS